MKKKTKKERNLKINGKYLKVSKRTGVDDEEEEEEEDGEEE